MKKFILCFSFLLVFSVSSAQDKKGKFEPERFQAELEQYIAKKACLSPAEAEKFFPLYSEMRCKQRELHNELKGLKRIKPVTDSECKENIKKRDELEVEMKQIQQTYHEKFMRILPAKKVYDVIKAEDKFHRQMFKRTTDKNQTKK